jgi:predicted ATPase
LPTFRKLELEGWRQFRSISIEFDDRLTVLTGANGSGKTTILALVSAHFGWYMPFVSTPRKRSEAGGCQYFADAWDPFFAEPVNVASLRQLTRPRFAHQGPEASIGAITYSDGATASIRVPEGEVASVYNPQMTNAQPVPGLHIPSHRPVYSYQQVQSIPVVPRRRNDACAQYLFEPIFLGILW